MRLRHHRAPALVLLLVPALRALAATAGGDGEDAPVARAALPEYVDVDALPSAVPDPKSKATKDAPVDGLDGKPHEGPWVDPATKSDKKPPAAVEELRPGATRISRPKGVTDDEWNALRNAEPDSVMDDPDRKGPSGVTGTEGGISNKDKERQGKGGKAEQIPQPPKSAPQQPHDGHDALADKEEGRKLGAPGLEKPEDLPDSPHDIHLPVPVSSKEDHLQIPPPQTRPHPVDDDSDGIIRPFHSFVLSLTMIVVSEIGDKTFLVAALMAMRHDRLVVFTAAFTALIAMTVLSAVLGHAVPALIPEKFTHLAAAILFLVFGVKLFREGLAMSPDEGVGEEMREVEQELEEKEDYARRHGGSRRKSSISPYVLESGRAMGRRSRSSSRLPAPRSPSASPSRSPSPSGSGLSGFMAGLANLFSLLLSPAWVQTFVMTFLGEWGDRSQIATIAMAAGSDWWWVTGGAVAGHGCCTAVAVLGGRALAGRVSMRVVTLGGAVAFIVFSFVYLLEAIYHE